MFTQRLNELLSVLGDPSSRKFAQAVGCDPSYIVRFRNGNRTPPPGGKASVNLAGYLFLYAERMDSLGELCAAVACPSDASEDEIRAALLTWLYDGQTPQRRKRQRKDSRTPQRLQDFGAKLDAVMNLAALSNVRLAKRINVDPSLISRYRRGKAMPHSNREIVEGITRTLYQLISDQNQLSALAELMGIEETLLKDGETGFLCFRSWLILYEAETNSLVEGLLDDLDHFSPDLSAPLFSREQLAKAVSAVGKEAAYTGIRGLQAAVLRFLWTVLERGGQELLLFSDQSTEWMTADPELTLQWASLMTECVRAGVKITIIHNIDRGLREMISAIRNWLPLYMSGMIDGFYNQKGNGDLFSHTLFLAPGTACIWASHPAGAEESARYLFETDPEQLDYYAGLYSVLMKDSRPLVYVDLLPEKSDSSLFYHHIEIAMTDHEVTIRRTAPPEAAFTISHPLMRQAFYSYFEQSEKERLP